MTGRLALALIRAVQAARVYSTNLFNQSMVGDRSMSKLVVPLIIVLALI